jgi:hypothetical protein
MRWLPQSAQRLESVPAELLKLLERSVPAKRWGLKLLALSHHFRYLPLQRQRQFLLMLLPPLRLRGKLDAQA